jgi:prolyl oligopeptidase
VPPTIYRLDTVTGKREVFFQPKIPFDSSQYELKQVFFKSKDGTQVPMFIAGKKGLKRDGSERLLMTGYGGFNVSETPTGTRSGPGGWQQGGWFALPNLRGGGEYGESWHEQGMFEKKQNVFDDWFAAAEYLIAQKYTSPAHFAISGPLERRPADGRVHHPAAGAVWRRSGAAIRCWTCCATRSSWWARTG